MNTNPTIPDAAQTAVLDQELKGLIADVLGLDPARAAAFGPETGLFGHLPELDSMAVAGLLTEMEDRLGIVIDDDDVDGEMLETYGGLLAFAKAKLAAG
jgi:acyl carrier protein